VSDVVATDVVATDGAATDGAAADAAVAAAARTTPGTESATRARMPAATAAGIMSRLLRRRLAWFLATRENTTLTLQGVTHPALQLTRVSD